MYAFEEQSRLGKIAEIGTWVLLFLLLVPGTALGFFAENSLPNSPLYPVKRGIEQVVLTLVSVNEGAKSAYELSLANTRFTETKKLLASNTPVTQTELQQFNTVATQLDAAQASISTLSDSVQKAQLQAQLKTSITTYQTQLAQMQQQLQQGQTAPTVQPQVNTTQQPNTQPDTQTTEKPTTLPIQQNTPTPGTNGDNGSPTPTPPSTATTVPNINTQSLTPQQRQDLEDQMQQLQDRLQYLQQNLQDTQSTKQQRDTKQQSDQ